MSDDYADGYGINIDKVLESPNFDMLTKMTLVMIQSAPYLTLGDYFKKLKDNELEHLLELMEDARNADECHDVTSQSIQDIVVMAEALAMAEGAAPQSEAEAHLNVNYFIMIANCVSLERKGLLEIEYDKLSFGVDVRSAGVVRMKPGADIDIEDEED